MSEGEDEEFSICDYNAKLAAPAAAARRGRLKAAVSTIADLERRGDLRGGGARDAAIVSLDSEKTRSLGCMMDGGRGEQGFARRIFRFAAESAIERAVAQDESMEPLSLR